MPLEVRFLHDPKATSGFVGCALFGKVFKFFKKEDGTWDAKKVIDVPQKKVDGYEQGAWFGFSSYRSYK